MRGGNDENEIVTCENIMRRVVHSYSVATKMIELQNLPSYNRFLVIIIIMHISHQDLALLRINNN